MPFTLLPTLISAFQSQRACHGGPRPSASTLGPATDCQEGSPEEDGSPPLGSAFPAQEDWRAGLTIVQPETVIRWHREGFRLHWRWKCRPWRPGRPKVSEEIRDLIRQMLEANVTWGAPRIHGELLKLGIDIGQQSVLNYGLDTAGHHRGVGGSFCGTTLRTSSRSTSSRSRERASACSSSFWCQATIGGGCSTSM